MRPNWDAYFLRIAAAVASRAECSRAMHGAVIVKDNRIVSTGYNGTPAGSPLSCLRGDCPRVAADPLPLAADYSNCIAIHAEQNAITYGRHDEMRGATIYITGPPCDMCTKLIAAAGIFRTVHAGMLTGLVVPSKPRVTVDDIYGIDPDFTGDLDSVEYVRRMRGG